MSGNRIAREKLTIKKNDRALRESVSASFQ